MKAQSLYLVASVLAGVFGVPLANPKPNVKTVTVYETVVHVVTTTHTIWVPASTDTPGDTQPDCDPEPTPSSGPDMHNKQPEPPKLQTSYSDVNSNPKPAPEKPNSAQPPPAQYNSTTEAKPDTKQESKPETIYTPPPVVKEEKPYVAPTPPQPVVKEEKPYVAPTSSQTYTPAPMPVAKIEPKVEVKPASSTEIVGDATYYTPGLGSCGITNTDDDDIVAIPHALMEAKSNGNPNKNPLCGKKVIATRGSNSVTCLVVDTCPGCNTGTLDLSPHAFKVLGNLDEGRIPITWSWVDSY